MGPAVFTLLLTLFCNFIVSNAWSREIELQLTYLVQWGDMEIASAKAEWVFKEDTYTMSGASKTLGIVKKLEISEALSKLSGNIIEGDFQPLNFKYLAFLMNKKNKLKQLGTQ